MKNVSENLVEYVTTDGERVGAPLIRLGRFDGVFELTGGFPPLLNEQGDAPASDVFITNRGKAFQNFIEFRLDWHLVGRQNGVMTLPRSHRLGVSAVALGGFHGVSHLRILFCTAVKMINEWLRKFRGRELTALAVPDCGQWRSPLWTERMGANHG